MANVLTITNSRVEKENIVREYSLQLSGNYTQVTGEVIDLTSVNNTGAQNPKKIARAIPGTVPVQADIAIMSVPFGYDIIIKPNAAPTLKNFFMRIFTTADTELGAGAYGADIKSDVIQFSITQKKKHG